MDQICDLGKKVDKENTQNYDVCVVGAGHAGIEAALAASRLGCSTIVITMNLESIGKLPCNPSIGGTGKGQLVKEIDALGGEMGKLADYSMIQFRMLNRSKGAAVHSPRCQVDKRKYEAKAKCVLELQNNLRILQAEIVDITFSNQNANLSVKSVITATGREYFCKSIILTVGTYMNSSTIVGNYRKTSGPDGYFSSLALSENLKKAGIFLRKFKTGTPPRLNKCSINFKNLNIQNGDNSISPFHNNNKNLENKVICHIAHTNENTHRIILNNIEKSPIYSGEISGIGPRYCPSIEDKIMRFRDKKRHQLFIEPMGIDTEEVYLQGFSTSMPEDIQEKMVHSMAGFEKAEIMRYGYAIEYECCDSLALLPSLEMKNINGLFCGGQFNGTSGYEEAAAQGLIAGINAARKIKNQKPFTLDRSTSYIGVLIDDLITKGVDEPYRMMISRAEYRLILRQDNADIRLGKLGYKIGLLPKINLIDLEEKIFQIKNETKRLNTTVVCPTQTVNFYLKGKGTNAIETGTTLSNILKRPEISYADLEKLVQNKNEQTPLSNEVKFQVEVMIKYEGYIKKQLQQIARFKSREKKQIPKGIDYLSLMGLKTEAKLALNRTKPLTIGHAMRVRGVTPADIEVLLIYLKLKETDKFK